MRRTFAGPMSSNYKEKDVKVTQVIDKNIAKTSYIKILEKDMINNPNGKY